MKTVEIYGKINEKMVNKVREKLSDTSFLQESLRIIINSKGGDMTSTFEIIDLIEKYENVETIALNDCMSSAVYIFLLGKRRYIQDKCNFVMHRPYYMVQDLEIFSKLTYPMLEKLTSKIKEDEEKIKSIFLLHGLSKSFVEKFFNEVKVCVTPEELYRQNIVDKIF